jgi:hypothetical protein
MISSDVEIAVDRARRLAGQTVWELLTTHEQTEAIYRELRGLDAERVAERLARPRDLNGARDLSDKRPNASRQPELRAAE